MKTIKKLLFLSILTASLASVFTLSTPALADGGWGGHGWGHGGGWGYGGGGWGHGFGGGWGRGDRDHDRDWRRGWGYGGGGAYPAYRYWGY